tara:strand:- start:8602 stop:8787 length:186 start_codon:yes stop_codon:yes gene_type:complete
MANDRLGYWSQVLLVIGGLNVGLSQLGYNVIGYLPSVLATVVFYLVGLAGLYAGYNMMMKR